MSDQRRNRVMMISSAVLALAPKCPVCFLAYFGIFGVATASASVYRAWLAPVTAVWLALTVGMLAFQRGGRHRYGSAGRYDSARRYGPALLGLGGALAVLLGKFIFYDQVPVYAGIVALAAAVVWRSWFRKATSSESCSQCDQQQLYDESGPKRPIELPTLGGQ